MKRRMAHNLLTDRLPDALWIGGIRYPVYTDFRRWILAVELFAEPFVEMGIKTDCAAKLLFPGENPLERERTGDLYRSMVHGIAWFASCGRSVRNGYGGERERDREEPVFDFTVDADLIYAAFMQTYGIDLCDPAVKLHFWKFMALLRNLPRETEFMQVVNLRRTDTSKIGNDDLRRQVRRAKAKVRIRSRSETGERKEKEHG